MPEEQTDHEYLGPVLVRILQNITSFGIDSKVFVVGYNKAVLIIGNGVDALVP